MSVEKFLFKNLNSISWPSPFKEIILQEAEYAGLMTAYHSYLVTNLDLQLVNMEVFFILFIDSKVWYFFDRCFTV